MAVEHAFPDAKATIQRVGSVGEIYLGNRLAGKEIWEVAPQTEVRLPRTRVDVMAGLRVTLLSQAPQAVCHAPRSVRSRSSVAVVKVRAMARNA